VSTIATVGKIVAHQKIFICRHNNRAEVGQKVRRAPAVSAHILHCNVIVHIELARCNLNLVAAHANDTFRKQLHLSIGFLFTIGGANDDDVAALWR